MKNKSTNIQIVKYMKPSFVQMVAYLDNGIIPCVINAYKINGPIKNLRKMSDLVYLHDEKE